MKRKILLTCLMLCLFILPVLSEEEDDDSQDKNANKMIEISIEITEINNTKASELGIQWTDTVQAGELSYDQSGKRTPESLPNVPTLIDSGEWSRYTALTGVLKILKEKGAAQVLSKPKLVTKSGTSADFLVGGEIPIVTSGLAGGSVDWKKYGLKMTILPKIVGKSKIDATVTTEISRLDWINQVGGNPAVITRQATSQIIIKNEQTLAIAGMIETTKEKQRSGIPILMDIPVLKYFFSREITSDTKTNVLIFVTPRIIK